MKSTAALLAIALPLTLLSTGAGAAERFDHYQGAPAATIQEALSNLEAYNEFLESLLDKGESLSDADMGKIHQLSYTLENALERIEEELDGIAANLEEVHQGSEQLQRDRVLENGSNYLKRTRQLTGR
ncbi:arginase family protein [Parahaliea maris]|uniref:Arginase family protein n=1 Tax=Parahaliea maris TaxID=2716870 RepID=A0A5C8ZU38_9GAMM|nr:DUF6746 family protein [Parahaliea maris]TXS91294.1 arginase family protein [Parahaliea maris]